MGGSGAADAWARQLRAWSIPDELLEAVDESPYGWPQHLWARRSELARRERGETPTSEVLARLLPPRGVLLDVGAGRGRASLPFAGRGHRLVAIEKSAEMAAGLREEAAASGVAVDVIEASWPEAAPEVGAVDVAMCAHVVYDVQAIAPFLEAMHRAARHGTVVELTDRHPWAPLAPYYRSLHGLDRPEGPTVDDLVAVVTEVVGATPNVERWTRPGELWFESWDELLELQGRRLVVPAHRRGELRRLLEPDVIDADGRLYLGGADRSLATVWWE